MKLDKKAFIRELKKRATLLLPDSQSRVMKVLDAAEAAQTEEGQKKLHDLRERARLSEDAYRELNGLRIITIQNFLLAMANARAFFESTNLKPDETPYLKNTTRQEIKARFIGSDGGYKMTQAIKNQEQERIELRQLTTDPYDYPLVDIYNGDQVQQAMENVDLAYDLALKTDQELWGLLKLGVGAFVLTGSKPNRTYVPHSAVNTANLPTTNLLVPTSNSNSTKFRLEVIKFIVKYCAQWGNQAFADGEISPVTIYVPSLHVMDFLDEVDLDSPDNTKVEEIFQNGYVLQLAGKRFNIVGDVTLDPDEALCFVRTNKPVGTHFTKTSMDKVFPESIAQIPLQDRMANHGWIIHQTVYGAVMPNPQRVNYLAVRYRTV